MYVRKIAAAASFACGAALAFAPFASADTSSDSASWIDSLLGGAAPAATTTASDFQISFNGMDLFPATGNLATATTAMGQYGLAIAFGNGANATAEGGIGNYALADGTNALASAGSTAHATGFNFNVAEDIGNNPSLAALAGHGAPDGAYAGGGSLIGNTDATDAAGQVVASSNNAAYDFGNNGLSPYASDMSPGGNSGAFAGDSGLIGYNHVAGSGDTAYTNGNLLGFGDGSASVAGNNNFASSSGTETGMNEGAFSGFGNNNQAIADTNYTIGNKGVDATFGNGNYASVYGPNNSTADAGGTAAHLGNNNIAYVNDPYGMSGPADSAVAGSSGTVSGNSDLAEVLYTHGNASATGGSNLYDIITPFGTSAGPAAATAAADPAAATPITSTFTSEVASLNSLFQTEAFFAGVPSTDYALGPQGLDFILPADIVKDAPATGTPTILDYELFGVKPFAAGVSGDPGAADLFNGALGKFDDAFNVELYALFNNGALDPNAADFFGSGGSIAHALAEPNAMDAAAYFYNFAIGDLSGFFQTNLTFLDIPGTF